MPARATSKVNPSRRRTHPINKAVPSAATRLTSRPGIRVWSHGVIGATAPTTAK